MRSNRPSRRQTLRAGAALFTGTLVGCASSRVSRPQRVFDVHDFGAIGDGSTLDTAAIQRAIDQCAASGSNGRVLLRGSKRYLVGSLELKGGIDFHLADDARILISTRPEDYTIVAAPRVAASQPATAPRNDRAVFTARRAHGLRISGTGTIDGRWKEFMDVFDEENEWWRTKPFRPPMFQLIGCHDLDIRGIAISGSSVWTLHLMGCQRVLIDGIKIQNQLDVPNCDGINPDHSQDVEIRNCQIACGDDAIAIKTSRYGAEYGPTRNIRVHDCILETQDSGLKIGTESIQDIHDIVFERCTIKSACRGLCIQLRDEGSVYDVLFRDIEFIARYHSFPWWGRGEGISFTAIPRTPQTQLGTIHDIRIENVTGRCENSARICGWPDSRVRNVSLENVQLTLDRWTKYPGGVWDNRPTTVMEPLEQHRTPGWGIRHADNIRMNNCRIAWGTNRPEYFTHAIEAENVTGLNTGNFIGEAAHPHRDQAVVLIRK